MVGGVPRLFWSRGLLRVVSKSFGAADSSLSPTPLRTRGDLLTLFHTYLRPLWELIGRVGSGISFKLKDVRFHIFLHWNKAMNSLPTQVNLSKNIDFRSRRFLIKSLKYWHYSSTQWVKLIAMDVCKRYKLQLGYGDCLDRLQNVISTIKEIKVLKSLSQLAFEGTWWLKIGFGHYKDHIQSV